MKMEDRFWKKVDRSLGPDECWPWIASVSGYGYGYFSLSIGLDKPRTAMAHRLAYEISKGPIPEGLQINHSCGNSRCCNPAHLYAGTHEENMSDRTRMGRTGKGSSLHPESRPRLTEHWNSRLTEEQYGELFELRSQGLSYEKIGKRFGIQGSSVWKLVKSRELAQKGA